MAHGKETPRQKMIGMMYLVLTALLALNVSKEVLDAFVLVDEGLTKTTENFDAKNELIYSEFGEAAATNQSKVGPWMKKALEVKSNADNLYKYIQGLKIEIIKEADGDNAEAINGEEIVGELIKNTSNMDVPAQIMIRSDGKGKAIDLKNEIEKFRELLLSMVNAEDTPVIESIKVNLNTNNRKQKDGQIVSWQIANFQSLPLIAVITLMSKMQSDVRNSEAEMISYLFRQIDRGALKFNMTEATIIPNTNYVIQGNEYEAKVFIAARDTTQDPQIFIGRYDSVLLDNGNYEYNMVGEYETLPIIKGKGIYKRRGTDLGIKKWGGIIQIVTPDGSIKRPFKQEYQVAQPSLVVSPTKMNVFYVGVDNPVDISVSGIPADKIDPDITNGTIERTKVPGSYIVNPKRPGNSIISVKVKIDGTVRNMGAIEFRVKRVPDPIAKVGGKKGGDIMKNILLAQNGVFADMENFEFDLQFKVTEFLVSTTQRGFVVDAKSESNRFTDKQLNIMQSLKRGDKLYIEDIKAIGPDGTVRPLPTISFKIL